MAAGVRVLSAEEAVGCTVRPLIEEDPITPPLTLLGVTGPVAVEEEGLGKEVKAEVGNTATEDVAGELVGSAEERAA